MKLLQAGGPVEDLIARYGADWRQGIASDHLHLAPPDRVRTTGVRTWVIDDTGRAIPVLCSEIIAVWTEDGPISGRCGRPAVTESGTCEAHDRLD